MNKCVIVGAGTYGQVYAKYLSDEYEILGFVDDDPKMLSKKVVGYDVLGTVQSLLDGKLCLSSEVSVFVPIGNNETRCRLLSELRSKTFKTPSFIHKTVNMDDSTKVGNAVYILPSCSIMPYVEILDDVMISMGVNIAHHVKIEAGCFFSQGTNIGASMTIQEQAYVGIASTLMTGVKCIGKNSLIGAGAVVIRDVPENAVMAGVPAKVLKYKNNI
jgi:sugar O-acyltransferase (sialic acid O-acetyltransferase NeuD family)